MNTSGIARLLGQRGGRARSRRLTDAEKRRIASLGARARIRSLEAARRVAANLRYAGAAGELRGRAAVRRETTIRGRLPGIYRERS